MLEMLEAAGSLVNGDRSSFFQICKESSEEDPPALSHLTTVAGSLVNGDGFSLFQICKECSEEDLPVLIDLTKVVVNGKNRSNSLLVSVQGAVKEAVGLQRMAVGLQSGWHCLCVRVISSGGQVYLVASQVLNFSLVFSIGLRHDFPRISRNYPSKNVGEDVKVDKLTVEMTTPKEAHKQPSMPFFFNVDISRLMTVTPIPPEHTATQSLRW